MNIDRRLGRLEQQTPRAVPIFHFGCSAPAGLSAADHDCWHAARGQFCFTMRLGDCEVSR